MPRDRYVPLLFVPREMHVPACRDMHHVSQYNRNQNQALTGKEGRHHLTPSTHTGVILLHCAQVPYLTRQQEIILSK